MSLTVLSKAVLERGDLGAWNLKAMNHEAQLPFLPQAPATVPTAKDAVPRPRLRKRLACGAEESEEKEAMRFFTGLHQPSDARHFDASFISVNRLVARRSQFSVGDWIMDCGGFTAISSGKGHMPAMKYAQEIRRWAQCGEMLAAVSQDWMCEPFIIAKTGLDVETHQALTVTRYQELKSYIGDEAYLMPVLQGYSEHEYVAHVHHYGALLGNFAWVGVGSVCKRNGDPAAIVSVLRAIKRVRPDLRLHGFGLKTTSLQDSRVRSYLYSADSMAWSFASRKQGLGGNNYHDAVSFTDTVSRTPTQGALQLW